MCADGLYEIVLCRHCEPVEPAGRALLVHRSGRLFGSDARGRIYTGRLRLCAEHAVPKGFLNAIYETPPRRKPSPGAPAEMASIVSISGKIDPLARSQLTKIRIGRKSVSVKITYLGPLP